MHWRNRENRNDQERHVKASFFQLADKNVFLHIMLFVMLFVFKKFFLHFLLLVLLFGPVAKPLNSRSQIFFKTGVLKIFTIFTRKYRCLRHFLIRFQDRRPAFLFKKKETPAQGFFCEYCEIYKNDFFMEDMFIIPFQNFIWW